MVRKISLYVNDKEYSEIRAVRNEYDKDSVSATIIFLLLKGMQKIKEESKDENMVNEMAKSD